MFTGHIIEIPPLRDRKEDIEAMVQSILDQQGAAIPTPVMTFAHTALTDLLDYDWPGNDDELESVVWRAKQVSTGDQLILPKDWQREANWKSSKWKPIDWGSGEFRLRE